MANVFVLPTSELVRDLQCFEPVFCFYDEGIRGLVRDMVLINTGGYQSTGEAMDALMTKVVQDYETSLHLRYMENTLGKNAIAMDLAIEAVVTAIATQVQEMLESYFKYMQYEVSTSQKKIWLGDDLVVILHFLR